MKNRFAFFAALTLLIFGFTNFVSAQFPSPTPQVYQGCANGPFTYEYPPGATIWDGRDEKGKLRSIKVDKIETSESRFIFTFVPQQVTVYKGDKLNLEVFPFGRETDFGGNHLQNPSAPKSLQLPPISEMPEFKKSQLDEEGKQYLYWGGTPLENLKDAGEWFAVVHKVVRKEDKSFAFIPDTLPVPREFLGRETVPIFMVPPTLYYYKGQVVRQIGNKADPVPNARLIKLTSINDLTDRRKLEFDTTGLEPGEYWVTLQGTAVFKGQTPDKCEKTTPAVFIKIEEHKPEITLYPPYQMVKFKENDQVEVTATIKARTPFNLYWTAESNNQQGIDLSNCATSSGDSNITSKGNGLYEARCLVKTVHDYLKQGDRIPISARVEEENGSSASCRDNNKCTEIVVNHPPELTLYPAPDCQSGTITVTARASDVDVPAQTLKFSDWKIYEGEDNYKKEIPLPSLSYEYIPNAENPQSLKISGGLQLGVKYTFGATVYDGYDKTTSYRPTTLICTNSLAGQFFFGLATPDYRRQVIISDPEEWTTDTEIGNGNYSNEGRRYPIKEAKSIYDFLRINPPNTVEKNNPETLSRMVKAIKENPNYKLYVYGYADYKKTGNYDNCELSKWRIRNVVQVLEKELPGRVISGDVRDRAFGDNAAQTRNDSNTWSEERRQDRRVEVLYVLDSAKANPSEYQISKDCVKGSKKNANARNLKSRGGKKSKHKGARK